MTDTDSKAISKNSIVYDIASLILLLKDPEPVEKLMSLALSDVFHYQNNWRVKGKIEQVYDVLFDDAQLTKWWPAVYLNTKVIDSGEAGGEGKIISLETKGWMPYTLKWKYRVTKTSKPNLFKTEAWGDITGKGYWKLIQDGDFVDISYDWEFRPEKPAFRLLAPLFKPVSYFNHHWGMKKGEESLKLELARKNAKNPKELKKIPAPPQPTTTSPIPLLAGILVGMFFIFKALDILSRLFGGRRN